MSVVSGAPNNHNYHTDNYVYVIVSLVHCKLYMYEDLYCFFKIIFYSVEIVLSLC